MSEDLPEDLAWLSERTILQVRSGDWAYGMSCDPSTETFVSVVIPPALVLFGLDPRVTWEVDGSNTTWISLPHFLRCGLEGDVSTLENLFVEDEDVVFCTDGGQYIRDRRNLFVTKSFLSKIEAAVMYPHPCTNDVGASLVRMARMGEEAAINKIVAVKRPDAEELLAIKSGAWTQLQIRTERDRALDVIRSVAPMHVEAASRQARVDKLCQRTMQQGFSTPDEELLLEAVDLLEELLPTANAYAGEIDSAGWILNTLIAGPYTLHWMHDVDTTDAACGETVDPTEGELVDLDEVSPRHKRVCPLCLARSKEYVSVAMRAADLIRRVG